MALAVVQAASAQAANVSSLSVGPISTTTGNLVVVDWATYAPLGALTGVSDTAGNIFSPAYSPSGGSSGSFTIIQQFYVANAAGNASNSYSFTLSANGYPTATIVEVSGAVTASPLDLAETNGFLLSGTPFTTSGSTAQANEIVFGKVSSDAIASTCTTDANYVDQYNNFTVAGGFTATDVATRIVAATGTQTFAPTFTVSGSPVNYAITTYKGASGPPPANSNGSTLLSMGVG
jgi:hypothetical protein